MAPESSSSAATRPKALAGSPGPSLVQRRTFWISCSWWGGGLSVPVYFKALGDALVERGHRVVFLITGGRRDVDPEGPQGSEVVFWPGRRGASVVDARFAWKLLRRHPPDVCLANFSTVNLLMGLGWLRRVPVRIAYYHTLLEQVQADGGGRSALQKLRMLRKGAIYRLATHLVAVSERAAEDLRSIYHVDPDKITCFHNAAPDPYAGGEPVPPTSARELLAVSAIRLDPSKGPDLLIDAVAKLVGEGAWPEGFGLHLFGDGPQRQACVESLRRHGLQGEIVLRGRRPPTEVQDALAGARFSVLPSRSDNCPLAAIESLAMGTPVVGARAGGIPELVDGRSGVLVEANDVESLASGMRALLLDEEALAAKGRGARQRFLEHFELRGAVARQADWLESLR